MGLFSGVSTITFILLIIAIFVAQVKKNIKIRRSSTRRTTFLLGIFATVISGDNNIEKISNTMAKLVLINPIKTKKIQAVSVMGTFVGTTEILFPTNRHRNIAKRRKRILILKFIELFICLFSAALK